MASPGPRVGLSARCWPGARPPSHVTARFDCSRFSAYAAHWHGGAAGSILRRPPVVRQQPNSTCHASRQTDPGNRGGHWQREEPRRPRICPPGGGRDRCRSIRPRSTRTAGNSCSGPQAVGAARAGRGGPDRPGALLPSCLDLPPKQPRNWPSWNDLPTARSAAWPNAAGPNFRRRPAWLRSPSTHRSWSKQVGMDFAIKSSMLKRRTRYGAAASPRRMERGGPPAPPAAASPVGREAQAGRRGDRQFRRTRRRRELRSRRVAGLGRGSEFR